MISGPLFPFILIIRFVCPPAKILLRVDVLCIYPLMLIARCLWPPPLSLPSFRSSSFYYKGTQAGRPLLLRPSLCNNLYQGQCSTCNADLQFPIQDPFMLCICTMRIMRYDGTLNCECGGGSFYAKANGERVCALVSWND